MLKPCKSAAREGSNSAAEVLEPQGLATAHHIPVDPIRLGELVDFFARSAAVSE